MHAIRPLLVLSLMATQLIALAACGRKDEPLPPLRYVPVPARDLSLHQQGGVLIFDMGYPQTTTSGQALPGLDAVEMWWMVLPETATSPQVEPRTFTAQAEQLLRLTGPELASSVIGDRIETRFPVPESIDEGDKVVFAVRSVSSTDEASEFSNQVGLEFAPPPAPPTGIELVPVVDGVRVEWETPEGDAATNVYRRAATQRRYGPPLARVEAGASSFLDGSARYGNRYIYTVRSVVSAEPLVESDASVETEIEYRDTFAPRPPASVLALGESGGVRLAIESSPDADAVGYIIYRQDPGAEFRRVTADPVEESEFVDRGLTPGLSYRYYATAVDAAGNEGEPSQAVTVTVPE